MYGILVDGCLDYLEIAIVLDEEIISSRFFKLNKNFTKIFNIEIDNLMKDNKLKNSDIKNLYIVNGPGSFTSIKLVSLFANTFKMVYQKVNLYTLNTLKWNLTHDNELVVIDAKSSLFYAVEKKSSIPSLFYSEGIKELEKGKVKYFYNLENKKDILEKWNYNKHNFEPCSTVCPLYIKPAIYDSNKK